MTGAELRSLRESLGWSQQKLADYLGLKHRVQVHNLEVGISAIWGAKLILLEQLKTLRLPRPNLEPPAEEPKADPKKKRSKARQKT